ncbi:hypothetical protein B0O80DRAFT_428554 [Mortierella sp. GBAus27b]|nr:hypothetical protein B0O80DRAFT_428554 [Mortierella sp. GBAus27b]
MRISTALLSVASALLAFSKVEAAVAGGYLLINPKDGAAKLKALADNADKIPINRLFLSFARPTMVYGPDSKTLQHVGLVYSDKGDHGFADIKAQVEKLQKGGVQVFLSVGGWNYGCYPIQKYGGFQGCTEKNQWCYVCEPEEQQTTAADFDIFPQADYSPTWKEAAEYVTELGKGGKLVFDYTMIPGKEWQDPKQGGDLTKVPCSSYFYDQKRDPYQDLVYLAKDLGLAGVDIDCEFLIRFPSPSHSFFDLSNYEEMWHADYNKAGPSSGPWTNYQTVYKYATIMRDVQINIQKIASNLLLGTASAAVGALSTNWWGGNLKGVWYNVFQWYPEIYNFVATGANSGGVNVMSYDPSSNEKYHECPEPGVCSLSQQVNYYMDSYKKSGMGAHVGYEIGAPAYPDKHHDPENQLPLTQTALTFILNAQGANGGFFWDLYKPADGFVDANSVAQQVCKKALGDAEARCSGSIPQPPKPISSPWLVGGDEEMRRTKPSSRIPSPVSIAESPDSTTCNKLKAWRLVRTGRPI